MIWSIQVLRFIAALMVVYVHAASQAISATGSNGVIPVGVAIIGHAGVDIFFVISGLIITKIARGRVPSEFIRSRVKRIVPLYFLFAIPAVAIRMGTGHFGWRDALATFLFWPATDKLTFPALAVGWTLCFEMLFYACAALVLVGRRWVVIILGAYGIALTLRPIAPPFQFLGDPIILEFLLGVAIAYAPNWRPAIWGLPLGVICLVAAGLTGIVPATKSMDVLLDGFLRVLIFGVPSAIIVYGSLQIKARESIWTYLGEASYSLYLSHGLIMIGLLTLTARALGFWENLPMQPDFIIFIFVSASLLFAWRVHKLFEKPILALLRGQRPAAG